MSFARVEFQRVVLWFVELGKERVALVENFNHQIGMEIAARNDVQLVGVKFTQAVFGFFQLVMFHFPLLPLKHRDGAS